MESTGVCERGRSIWTAHEVKKILACYENVL
jgi:hypothetical protein